MDDPDSVIAAMNPRQWSPDLGYHQGVSELSAAPSAPVETVCRDPTGYDVTVLLATFEGALYLRPQLASLIAQAGVRWRLLWRDDGSSDGTVALMEAFARDVPGRLERVGEAGTRLGVAGSYHALAVHAPADGCIAFCDQDDVWLPHKLARGLAALAEVPPGQPALYCARQLLVDAALRPLGTSLAVHTHPDFIMALAQNVATGCTVMLNAAAAALLRAAPPPAGTLHDWWSYLLVAGAGGQLIVDDEPVVLYRQHRHNLIGAPHTRWRRAIAALRRGPGAFMDIYRAHVAALSEHAALLTPFAAAAAVELRDALRSGLRARLSVLRRFRMRRQTRLETALFVVWFLIG